MSTTAKWVIAIIVIIIIIAGIWYFAGNKGNSVSQTASSTEPIKIGFIEPLTGDLTNFGAGGKAAVELAVEKINANGGIGGRKIEMVYEDGKCDGAAAATAAQKLVNIDKVVAIIGGVCSGETIAAAPVAEQGKVVLISPGSSSPVITTAGDYIFRDYPSDSFQGSKAASLAMGELKGKNIAVLACQNDYCNGLEKVFVEKVQAMGGKIVAEEKFDDKTTKDLRTQLLKIKSAKPDVVFFPAMPDSVIVGLKQMKEIGLKAKVVGGDSWDDLKIVEGAGKAAEGAIYIKPAAGTTEDFKTAMAAKLGSNEIIIGAPQAYDAINILAQVITQVGSDGAKIKDALYQIKDFQGISGVISFDQNGDMLDAKYDIKTIKDGKVVDFQ